MSRKVPSAEENWFICLWYCLQYKILYCLCNKKLAIFGYCILHGLFNTHFFCQNHDVNFLWMTMHDCSFLVFYQYWLHLKLKMQSGLLIQLFYTLSGQHPSKGLSDKRHLLPNNGMLLLYWVWKYMIWCPGPPSKVKTKVMVNDRLSNGNYKLCGVKPT